ncbi:MAG: WYL domain-containing protein, partial [Propionibacteriales bacterium]
MTATDQVARMLALVPYLQRLPGTTLTEAAIEFGVDPDQILNDLRALWMCGLPGGLPDDLIEVDMDGIEADGQIYISNAEYLTRPITFSHEEATALTVALHAIAEAATEEVAAGAASAAAKLQELTGRAPDVEVELEAGQLRIRQLLQQAI